MPPVMSLLMPSARLDDASSADPFVSEASKRI
jgi:hypothetical protein